MTSTWMFMKARISRRKKPEFLFLYTDLYKITVSLYLTFSTKILFVFVLKQFYVSWLMFTEIAEYCHGRLNFLYSIQNLKLARSGSAIFKSIYRFVLCLDFSYYWYRQSTSFYLLTYFNFERSLKLSKSVPRQNKDLEVFFKPMPFYKFCFLGYVIFVWHVIRFKISGFRFFL